MTTYQTTEAALDAANSIIAELRARLDRIEALHADGECPCKELDWTGVDYERDWTSMWWPCPTVKAARGEKEGVE